jgi:acetate kinase
MRILALNAGSSSIKCALIDSAVAATLFELQINNIGCATVFAAGNSKRDLGELTFARATTFILGEIHERLTAATAIEAVAHRIVHGGERFIAPTVVDDAVLDEIGKLDALAPLHNPPAVAMLKAARKYYRNVPHIAVFDTAFHHTLPARSREYAIPRAIASEYGLRRYGFHGINYAHISNVVARHLQKAERELRVIACHLGNGASVTAIECGHSVDTSMGLTPLEGLVMGTRCGDVDPGVLLALLRSSTFDVERLDRMLNFESGLLGLTGTFDFASIERRATEGDEPCRLAIAIYAHRIGKYIGAFAAVMGGVDAIAFSGGVGEHSALVRRRASHRLDFLGAILDADRNREAKLMPEQPVIDVATDNSRVRLLVVRADEQAQMVREAAELLTRSN